MTVVRILSTNLQNGRARPDALARVLAAWAPDVVVAQELAADGAEVLRAHLPYGVLRPGIDFSGVGLVGREPIAVSPVRLVNRTGLSGVLHEPHWELGGAALEVVGIHLTNPLQRPFWKARETRKREVEALERRESTAHPRVVIGDMNATPAWPLYRRLTCLGSDAARMTGRPRRTWAPLWWQPAVLRIDHAFVRGLRVVATNRARIRGTDHRALIVDVEVVASA